MVKPSHRSHAEARKKRRMPGRGNMVIHYVRRNPSKATCPITKKQIHGIPRKRPAQMRKLTKTQRRPSRPYGGVISHTALENEITRKVLDKYSE